MARMKSVDEDAGFMLKLDPDFDSKQEVDKGSWDVFITQDRNPYDQGHFSCPILLSVSRYIEFEQTIDNIDFTITISTGHQLCGHPCQTK